MKEDDSIEEIVEKKKVNNYIKNEEQEDNESVISVRSFDFCSLEDAKQTDDVSVGQQSYGSDKANSVDDLAINKNDLVLPNNVDIPLSQQFDLKIEGFTIVDDVKGLEDDKEVIVNLESLTMPSKVVQFDDESVIKVDGNEEVKSIDTITENLESLLKPTNFKALKKTPSDRKEKKRKAAIKSLKKH